jgi:hypothetical protein
MKIDYSPRQSGKTTRLIELLAKDNRRVLLTFSTQEENRLKNIYPEVAERIFYWETYKTKNKGRYEQQRVLIDNADYLLEKVIGDWIEVGTFNKDTLDVRDIPPSEQVFDHPDRIRRF